MKYADRNEAYKQRRREYARARYLEVIKNPEEKERRLQRSREHYAKNRDRAREVSREWEKLNRPARSLITRRRKLKLSTINELSPGEWESVVAECRNRCIVPECGNSPVTMDHVVPLSKGGRHHTSNLQPLCLSCNDRKGVRDTDYRTGAIPTPSGAPDALHDPSSWRGGA